MIETVILNYLHESLNVDCYMEKPEKEPEKYIIIERIGNPEKNHIKHCTLAVQSYENSLLKAAELNEAVKKVMRNIVVLDEIIGCHQNGDYNFTNPKTNKYRYQAVFEINYY